MKGLLRDVVMVAIGLNVALLGFAATLGMDSLVWLGAMNLVLCAVGVTIQDWLSDKEDSND